MSGGAMEGGVASASRARSVQAMSTRIDVGRATN